MRFDVCLMNPPYDEKTQLYIDFLNKAIEVSNIVVSVNPSEAFFARKAFKKNKEFKQKMTDIKPNIELGTNWESIGFKDAHPKSNWAISYWNSTNIPEKIKLSLNNNVLYVNSADDAAIPTSKYGRDFSNALLSYLNNNDVKTIYDIMIENPKNNQYFEKKGKEKIVNDINHNLYYVYMPYIIASYPDSCWVGKYTEDVWNGPAKVFVTFEDNNNAKHMYNTISANGKNKFNDFYKLIIKLNQCGYLDKKLGKCRYEVMPIFNTDKTYSVEELFNMIGMEYNKEEIDKILND